jgi:hypothetical protein
MSVTKMSRDLQNSAKQSNFYSMWRAQINQCRLEAFVFRTNERKNLNTILLLEMHRCSTALQAAIGHDCDAISEEVGLVHEMRRENHRPTSALALQYVPGLTTRFRVHSRRRLIEYDELERRTDVKLINFSFIFFYLWADALYILPKMSLGLQAATLPRYRS